jgi:hypothetical protein
LNARSWPGSQSSVPEVVSEDLDPLDLVSAATSIPQKLERTTCYLGPLGLGFATFLRWALEDIAAARQSPPGDTQLKFCANALMSARRALSCLVDEYLVRDGFAFCSDAPREAGDKARLLVRRGVFDELASGVLERAIRRRHHVEHRYEAVLLEDAEDTVQIVRATIETAVAKSNPYYSPGLLGTIAGGFLADAHGGVRQWFNRWSGPVAVIVVTASEPWAGVLIQATDTKATLRRVPLKNLSCDQLFDFLSILEQRVEELRSGGLGQHMFEAKLRVSGLWY